MIDEKKLIEERPEWLNPNCVGEEEYNKGWNACNIYWCNTIDRQPKVGEWIPVSEGLPKEDYDTVLVFLESNIYDIAIWHSEYGFRPWYAGYFEEATPEWESKVLAWQPLPEPYKGESE